MEKKKMFGTMIGVLAFVAVIAGVTYAWFTWQSEDTEISGTTGTFVINYDKGNDIGTTDEGAPITPSTTKEGGVNTVFSISKDTASLAGKAKLVLNITNLSEELAVEGMKWEVYKSTAGTSVDDAVYSSTALATGDFSSISVNWTCSDATYTTKEDCETNSGTWSFVSANPASITIFSDEQLNDTVTFYKLYIWIDGSMVGNEIIGASFAGNITASAVQDAVQPTETP